MTITTIDHFKPKTITREEAEAAFGKITEHFQEAMIAYGELVGDPHPKSCSATYRFVNALKDAVSDTHRDMHADACVLLNTIPILTMYLLGIEAAFVEHPHPRWRETQRARRVVYGLDLPSSAEPVGPATTAAPSSASS